MRGGLRERLSESDITDLLEVFLMHHKLVNKVNENQLGLKKHFFVKHKNNVNEIKIRLDGK